MGTRFGVLGTLEVLRDGVPIAVSALKQRIALATLLLQANQHVSLDQLAERMWDGREAPEDARGAVQPHIGRLRRTLGDRSDERRLIRTRGEGYVLGIAAADLDVAVFLDLVARARRADAERSLGRHRDALAHAERARAVARDGSFHVLEGHALTALAKLRIAMRTPAEAVAQARRAVELYRRSGHRLGEVRALRVIGEAWYEQGRGDAARSHRREVLALFSAIGSPEAAEIRVLLGE
ncbi:hypothetical protein Sru01_08550 [Sphaerisporangium rufum]|uniref:OmpR/PhoB-type domain-containing protein n=1 Tax=Sphaerisporangium rufum TaxID=1381558 RepID=A0A919QXX7_9ACTN|nr:winged helix-turn-helix domain-containing protein [Sphaerisporangium rufum]GII75873.1 hypothetical protein Sru01_08550 [Sphaerisporangium rufum]